MKKKLAIFISGEIRNCNLGNNINNFNFSDEFCKYILNKEMTDEYDINIFFSVDEINKKEVEKKFGDYVKDIIELNHQDIEESLDIKEIQNNYFSYFNNRISNPDKYSFYHKYCDKKPKNLLIGKFYKLYCAYKIMLNYENKIGFKHDYILYLRPDLNIYANIYPYLKLFEENKLVYSCILDWVMFGNYDVMCYLCNLVKIYGKYNYGEIIHDEKYYKLIGNYYKESWLKIAPSWGESPEVQIIEHMLEYFYKNNISSNNIASSFHRLFHPHNDRFK